MRERENQCGGKQKKKLHGKKKNKREGRCEATVEKRIFKISSNTFVVMKLRRQLSQTNV